MRVCWLLVVCVLSIHSHQPNWSQKRSSNRHSLFLSSLSCLSLSLVSLSLVSHTHSPIVVYIYMLHSNWEQFSFQPVLHRAHATQSHPFHPLTIYSSIHLQTHSHSTNHSLIPQAHAIIPLHSESVSQPFFHFWLFTCVTIIKPPVLQLSNCKALKTDFKPIS